VNCKCYTSEYCTRLSECHRGEHIYLIYHVSKPLSAANNDTNFYISLKFIYSIQMGNKRNNDWQFSTFICPTLHWAEEWKISYWNTQMQFVIASVKCNFAQYLCKKNRTSGTVVHFEHFCCEHSTRFTELNVINLASVILCMLRILKILSSWLITRCTALNVYNIISSRFVSSFKLQCDYIYKQRIEVLEVSL
jgi:hypothetical protein